jgi:hypothetical protein
VVTNASLATGRQQPGPARPQFGKVTSRQRRSPSPDPQGILTLPEALWELSLGIYLIAKGFSPDANLFHHERRDPEADDLAAGVRQPVAPDRAVVAGVGPSLGY